MMFRGRMRTMRADKKDVVLIRMGTNDAEVKDITSRLFNNIPSSWEIGKKTIVDYDKMKDPETELNADIKNPKIYMTVILNIDDVISGKYPISLFRMLKFYKRDFYVIATQSTPEQKEEDAFTDRSLYGSRLLCDQL